MIEVRGGVCVSGQGRAAAALDREPVLEFLDSRTGGTQRGCHHRDPIRFLDAQFLRPARDGATLGERGGDEQDRIFVDHARRQVARHLRSEEHTSELQSLMRNSYAVFCWKKKNVKNNMNYVLNNINHK